ncbi:MAG: type II secretion system protein [Patescibacteria group bacterium]|nr:type II secretion system protein [Patescibacteria group bacterium]
MSSLPKDKRGFSLVEMLIVVGIIGLLSSFTAWSLTNSRPKARLAVTQQQLNSLQAHLVICESDNDVVDFRTVLPVVGEKICAHANVDAVFPVLPSSWDYVASDNLGEFKASTAEGSSWSITCSERGCVTTP